MPAKANWMEFVQINFKSRFLYPTNIANATQTTATTIINNILRSVCCMVGHGLVKNEENSIQILTPTAASVIIIVLQPNICI